MDLNSRNQTPRYSEQEYWEKRYETEDEREWLCDYGKVSHLIRNVVKPEDKILVIGCGNSPFSARLVQDGYEHVTNIDYAASVIENMRTKYPEMTWLQMDMRKLEFDSNSFSVVIEKATLDALLDEERDQWNVSDEGVRKMDQVLKEINRVLTNSGIFISISFAQPHFRLPLYAHDDYGWSPAVHTIGEHFHHFIYIMSKGHTNTAEIQKYAYAFKRDQVPQHVNPVVIKDDENFLCRISVSD